MTGLTFGSGELDNLLYCTNTTNAKLNGLTVVLYASVLKQLPIVDGLPFLVNRVHSSIDQQFPQPDCKTVVSRSK